MQSNLNSEFVHYIRSIAMWGRHSGGDEPKANPQERLNVQIFKKIQVFWSPEFELPFLKIVKNVRIYSAIQDFSRAL